MERKSEEDYQKRSMKEKKQIYKEYVGMDTRINISHCKKTLYYVISKNIGLTCADKSLLHTCITFKTAAIVVLNTIMTLSSIGAWGSETVINVFLTEVTFVACVWAVTQKAVDSIDTYAIIMAWQGLETEL